MVEIKPIEILADRASDRLLAFQRRKRRREDEEEERQHRRRRRPKDQESEASASRHGRQRGARPDFTIPSSPRRLPIPFGPRPFHFDFKGVSRRDPSRHVRSGGHSASPASDHARYVEREGAPEPQLSAAHADYVERAGAAEMRAEIGEIAPDLHIDGVRAVYSNISDRSAERLRFWHAVEASERTVKHHVASIDIDTNSEWFSRFAASPHLPAHFCAALNEALSGRAASDAGKPLRCPIPVEEVDAVMGVASRLFGWSEQAPPLTIRHGRSGRVQYRLVAALPEEVGNAGRDQIVRRFCAYLEQLGAMFTAVIHAPDEKNDARNYHLHIILYDRPCTYLQDRQLWDFEVVEEIRHGRQVRLRRPLQQKKIPDFSQSVAGRTHAGKAFPKHLKSVFADCVNVALGRAGQDYRYSAESFETLGIERTGTRHLGTDAAALEAVGIVTEAGTRNAQIMWQDERRTLERNIVHARTILHLPSVACAAAATLLAELDARSLDAELLRIALDQRRRLVSDLHDVCGRLDGLALQEAQLRSRAERTLATCIAQLERATTRHRAAFYRERKAEAEQFLAEVDEQLRPFVRRRQELAEAENEGWRHFFASDKEIAENVERIRGRMAREARAAGEAVVAAAPGPQPRQAAPDTRPADPPPIVSPAADPAPTREQDWDALINRIARERIEIVAPGETPALVVPGLSASEQELLHTPALAERSQKRLQSIKRLQDLEKQRLAKAHEAGRSGEETKAVATLEKHWQKPPEPDPVVATPAASIPAPSPPSAPPATRQADDAARARVRERLQAHVPTPARPLRRAFDEALAEILAEGHRLDRALFDRVRPLLIADPPLIEIGRQRDTAKTDSAWTARLKPGVDEGRGGDLKELRQTPGGRAFLDRFLPHLERISPLTERPRDLPAEEVAPTHKGAPVEQRKTPPPVEPDDAVQQAWLNRNKNKTR